MSGPDEAEIGEPSLEEIPAAPSTIPKTLGPSSGTPTKDANHLQKGANKALEELLATKLSINAHWQKLVWKLSMDLCQNESNTTETFRGAKTVCDTTIQEAKAACACSL